MTCVGDRISGLCAVQPTPGIESGRAVAIVSLAQVLFTKTFAL